MAVDLSKYNKEDFTEYEQEVINAECGECGHFEEEEVGECSECGSGDIVLEWGMEGIECSGCKEEFEPDEDFYAHDKEMNVAICIDCYDKL